MYATPKSSKFKTHLFLKMPHFQFLDIVEAEATLREIISLYLQELISSLYVLWNAWYFMFLLFRSMRQITPFNRDFPWSLSSKF